MRNKKTVILAVLFIIVLSAFCASNIKWVRSVRGWLYPEKISKKEPDYKSKNIELVKHFTFSRSDSLSEWKEKRFGKKVVYTIESADGESYVRAKSENSCSAMYYEIKLDTEKRPFLSWKWKVNKFPEKKQSDRALTKDENDFAARMYVIFPALFFANSKALEYVWSKDMKEGEITSSPYSSNIKIVVASSGGSDRWVSVERNIYDDYIKAFKYKPQLMIGAIAFMSDSDSTGTEAEALFGDIKIFYRY